MVLSVSILSLENKSDIISLAKEQIDYLHLDIMDGIYVDNKTEPFLELKKNLLNITKPYDVHLMVKDVLKYIEIYKELKPDIITFHIDAVDNVEEIIHCLKENNIKVGIAIKPDEDISILEPFLNKIDLVLVMSVVPGKGGQEFIPKVLNKITNLRKIKEEKNLDFLIEIDGGINEKNIEKCLECDMIVVGSFITNGNFKKQIRKLRNVL